ncbi:MAG: hypothetical protein HW403_708, partial [Dehalococcoidia bacterium]|nr:hypothetical protein [Dehalococcoidia bacterium]
MLDLSIIIVSYNVRELLGDCLRSLYSNVGISMKVYVADNDSHDGSADLVAAEFPQTHLMRSPINGGYAYANNLALKDMGLSPASSNDESVSGQQSTNNSHSSGRYILLLNPDTSLPSGALRSMVEYMDEHPEVGIAGPKLVRQDGTLDLACRRSFPTPEISLYRMLGISKLFPNSRRFARYNLTYLDPDLPAEVDSVVGAFMMIRREAIEQAGLLDETFFLYGEDLDLALRIKSKGWKVMYYPEVTVLHYKGESSRRHRSKALIEFYRSMLIFYRKHYARDTFFLLDWIIVAAILLRGAIAYAWYLTNLVEPRELFRPRSSASGS